jgi:MFS transporter, DHA1 family, multidrug resistance protein
MSGTMTDPGAITSEGLHPERGDLSHVPQGWRLVLIVGGLSLFGPLCIDMYLPALPEISRDLHASTSAVQLTLTMCLVGVAAGQLVIGPLSDRIGRRPPLLVGICGFMLSSLACTLVNNVYALDGLRFVQGLGGAAGIVIARAVVRDLFEGVAVARFFSTLLLVTGLGPILAPQLGALILRFTSWRGIFVALALVAGFLLVISYFKLPETLSETDRHVGGLRSTFAAVSVVGRDRSFIAYGLILIAGFGALFAYVAASPFVLQDIYGLSPQLFGLVFALNGAGLVLGAQFNGHLVWRVGTARLLTFGLIVMTVGSTVLLVAVCTHWLGLGLVLASFFTILFSVGFIGPNAQALAMQNHARTAGTAAALLGSGQFLFGALVAPLVGVAGNQTALPMALVMVGLTGTAIALRFGLARTTSEAPTGTTESSMA